MRVAESAPGCHTLSHGTSWPHSARPRATGRPYEMVMVVSATFCEMVPRWLNGYPWALAAHGTQTATRHESIAAHEAMNRVRMKKSTGLTLRRRRPSIATAG